MEMLEIFLKRVAELMRRGDAREETFYPTLETLIKSLAASLEFKNIDVTTLPKRTEAGNPDFRIWDGSHRIT